MPPAVFLDRDGTLIEDRGHLRAPGEVVFFPETVPALRELQKAALLFIVTHQSGIAKGLLTAAEVEAVNRHVTGRLAQAGVHIREVYCCPHDRADGCRCIKPEPYHLRLAARDHGVDLARSFVLGDHPHDVELAVRAGATGIYLLSGHGRKHRAELPPGVRVAEGIGEAGRRVAEMLGLGGSRGVPGGTAEETA
jgi:histidinol-phosphate phosphatase family protein